MSKHWSRVMQMFSRAVAIPQFIKPECCGLYEARAVLLTVQPTAPPPRANRFSSLGQPMTIGPRILRPHTCTLTATDMIDHQQPPFSHDHICRFISPC